MFGSYIDCQSQLNAEICGKLYLNSATADVNFIFESDFGFVEIVSAHKCFLASGSSVFNTMFYGPLKEDDDIAITDASVSAFKEFLQFFYLPEVQLTPENLAEVTNLCNKYDVTDCIESCVLALQDTMTTDDLCWGYNIATLLDDVQFIEFCERKIKENALEVLQSEGFLDCNLALLDKILEIIPSSVGASEIVTACMQWAKSNCARRNVYRTAANLKESFGKSFKKIPFRLLKLNELTQHVSFYKKFFNGKELKAFVDDIIENEDKQKVTLENVICKVPMSITSSCQSAIAALNFIDCDRRSFGELRVIEDFGGDVFSAFTSTKNVLLQEFYVALHGIVKFNDNIRYDINVKNNGIVEKLITGQATAFKGHSQLHIIPPESLEIEAGKLYIINVYLWDANCIEYMGEVCCHPALKDIIQVDDVRIRFRTNKQHGGDFITRILFHLNEPKTVGNSDENMEIDTETKGDGVSSDSDSSKDQPEKAKDSENANKCIVC